MDNSGIIITLPAWAKLALVILGPVIVAAVKSVIPSLRESIPAWAWPMLSALIAVLLSALGIDTSGLGLATAAALGLAGAKARDLAVGKSAAADPEAAC